MLGQLQRNLSFLARALARGDGSASSAADQGEQFRHVREIPSNPRGPMLRPAKGTLRHIVGAEGPGTQLQALKKEASSPQDSLSSTAAVPLLVEQPLRKPVVDPFLVLSEDRNAADSPKDAWSGETKVKHETAGAVQHYAWKALPLLPADAAEALSSALGGLPVERQLPSVPPWMAEPGFSGEAPAPAHPCLLVRDGRRLLLHTNARVRISSSPSYSPTPAPARVGTHSEQKEEVK